MKTNVFGVLCVSRAFAAVLARHGGSALLTAASIGSWFTSPLLANHAASKAAVWNVSNGQRNDPRAQGTRVMTLRMALVDTGLTPGIDAPKSSDTALPRR